MADRKSNGCCGCIFGAIAVIIVLLLIVGFFVSKYITCEKIGIADTPGILHRFNDTYPNEATLRSEGMENWKVYDFMMWIIKSGNYQPAT